MAGSVVPENTTDKKAAKYSSSKEKPWLQVEHTGVTAKSSGRGLFSNTLDGVWSLVTGDAPSHSPQWMHQALLRVSEWSSIALGNQKSTGPSSSLTCHGRPCALSMSMKGSGSISSMLNTPSPDHLPVSIIALPIMAGTPVV